jgi:hypothetical protein
MGDKITKRRRQEHNRKHPSQASKQSSNVILDLSRSKMSNIRALSRTKHYLHNNKHCLRKLLVITKDNTVIDLKDEL